MVSDWDLIWLHIFTFKSAKLYEPHITRGKYKRGMNTDRNQKAKYAQFYKLCLPWSPFHSIQNLLNLRDLQQTLAISKVLAVLIFWRKMFCISPNIPAYSIITEISTPVRSRVWSCENAARIIISISSLLCSEVFSKIVDSIWPFCCRKATAEPSSTRSAVLLV